MVLTLDLDDFHKPPHFYFLRRSILPLSILVMDKGKVYEKVTSKIAYLWILTGPGTILIPNGRLMTFVVGTLTVIIAFCFTGAKPRSEEHTSELQSQ